MMMTLIVMRMKMMIATTAVLLAVGRCNDDDVANDVSRGNHTVLHGRECKLFPN